MKKSLIVISILLIISLAFAGNYRINGMGGAGLAVVNDVETVTYNPSLMGNLGFFNLRLLGTDLTANQKLLTFLQEASNDATVTKLMDDMTKIASSDNIVYLLKNYAPYLNDDLYLNAELNSGLVLNLNVLQLGVGANIKARVLMNFDTASLAVDTFNVSLLSKVGVAVSTGFPFLKVGAGLYDEAKIVENIPQGTSVTELATDLQTAPIIANRISGDFSATLQLGSFRLSAVSRNVLTSPVATYTFDDIQNAPISNDISNMISNLSLSSTNISSALMDNMTLGFAYVNKKAGFILSAQIDDFKGFLDRIGTGPTADNPSLVKYLHFGVEKKLLPFLTLRAGLNQGYPTFGGDIFLLLGRVGFSYYGSEAGMLAGDQIRQNFELHLDLLF